jgi:DNA modification methylase
METGINRRTAGGGRVKGLLMDGRLEIKSGDCREILPTLAAGSVQCCVTSPPYWGLRDYGTAEWEGGSIWCEHKIDQSKRHADAYKFVNGQGEGGKSLTSWTTRNGTDNAFKDCPKCGARRIDSQLGLESTPEEYIATMVGVFREVWRVLRLDGTLWVNMGDSYVSNPATANAKNGFESIRGSDTPTLNKEYQGRNSYGGNGLKPKDLCMMPARLAMALQADGWYLRSEIVWHKPNPMPESVTDRPTKAHEMIYLLAKQERYFYDAEAIREPHAEPWRGNGEHETDNPIFSENRMVEGISWTPAVRQYNPAGRNKRSVWTIATQPYAEAHFATFPEEIPKLCILAGSKPGDTILDPFAGSGTVGQVALELGRRAILIELNPAYIELAEERTNVTPGFF